MYCMHVISTLNLTAYVPVRTCRGNNARMEDFYNGLPMPRFVVHVSLRKYRYI